MELINIYNMILNQPMAKVVCPKATEAYVGENMFDMINDPKEEKYAVFA
ncbi:hypothetical protein [Xenorhabdus eapokensis]|uniref:Uncharacterized protein n=1 Tax=Xenorhabdus eapokensis TaxID=1873482 RepID=A0A1Q5TIN6_9GAMM|nr:hypothetical protein [Xenorhabdus eapokensis]OKP00080.1 hypothetical protein Xedl_03468 [Xenorhabdus eapokensis]